MSEDREHQRDVAVVKAGRLGPGQSPLWPHLETIRSMRRARKSWAEIVVHLEQTHGLKCNRESVYRFFKRAAEATRSPNVEAVLVSKESGAAHEPARVAIADPPEKSAMFNSEG